MLLSSKIIITKRFAGPKDLTGTDATQYAHWMQRKPRQSQKPQKSNVAGRGQTPFADRMGRFFPPESAISARPGVEISRRSPSGEV
jgi:hypothetical protein